jgi:hypothetical protein
MSRISHQQIIFSYYYASVMKQCDTGIRIQKDQENRTETLK